MYTDAWPWFVNQAKLLHDSLHSYGLSTVVLLWIAAGLALLWVFGRWVHYAATGVKSKRQFDLQGPRPGPQDVEFAAISKELESVGLRYEGLSIETANDPALVVPAFYTYLYSDGSLYATIYRLTSLENYRVALYCATEANLVVMTVMPGNDLSDHHGKLLSRIERPRQPIESLVREHRAHLSRISDRPPRSIRALDMINLEAAAEGEMLAKVNKEEATLRVWWAAFSLFLPALIAAWVWLISP